MADRVEETIIMAPGSAGTLFGSLPHTGVRAVMTGQVGVDKKPFCERVAQIARDHGKEVVVCHVGDMMYALAPDVTALPLADAPTVFRRRSVR